MSAVAADDLRQDGLYISSGRLRRDMYRDAAAANRALAHRYRKLGLWWEFRQEMRQARREWQNFAYWERKLRRG